MKFISKRSTDDTKRINYALDLLNKVIDFDEDRYHGLGVVHNTRFPVSMVFAQLVEGDSLTDIAENFDLDFQHLKDIIVGFSILFDTSKGQFWNG